ncbi:SBBP repeat-containing protein [Granulicella sibirica]|nr:SBBP repeat-containing protein [Granulicella sibirica]
MSTVLAVAADNPAVTPATRQRLLQSYGDLPMSFTANQGQADPRFAFLAQGRGYSIQLGRKGAELTIAGAPKTNTSGQHAGKRTLLQLNFPGANEASTISGLERLPGDNNYLTGADPSGWHTSVPNYTRVKYAGLYPGVDLVYYGNHRQLEFDFLVAPQVDVNTVRMNFKELSDGEGEKLSVNSKGELVLGGKDGTVLLHKPVLYQVVTADGKQRREPVEGEFVVDGPQSVKFHVGAYDHTRELVIDPTLVYSTYVGTGFVSFQTMTVDPKGDAYVMGTSTSIDESSSVFFVDKYNPSGTAILYTTFVGADSAVANAIAADAAGDAYIVGSAAHGFPTTSGAYQRTYAGQSESFVMKLNPTGTAPIYSTYLNGPTDPAGATSLVSVTLDGKGDAYLLGKTTSSDFPITPGVFQPVGSANTLFLTKLNPTGSALVYSTFIGGDGENAAGLALDTADNAYVLGSVGAAYPTTAGAFSNTGQDFLAKVNPTASKLVYYTLLREFQPSGLAVDGPGNAYLAGTIAAQGAPSFPGLPETSCSQISCANAFVIKLNTAGSALSYSAFLGQSTYNQEVGFPTSSLAYGIAVDATGDAYITGTTNDELYPVTPDAYQTSFVDANPFDDQVVFLTKLDPSGSKVLYSTFIGNGSEIDGDEYYIANAIGLDKMGGVTIGGSADGFGYPITIPPSGDFEFTSYEAFLTKFNFGGAFCSFTANLQLETAPDKTQGFALESSFALGSSTALQPETVPLTLAVGSQTMTIPAGKLVKNPLGYSFSGTVDGVRLLLFLAPANPQPGAQATCGTPAYKLSAVGTGAVFGSSARLVDVAVSIGDESGSTEVKAIGLQ